MTTISRKKNSRLGLALVLPIAFGVVGNGTANDVRAQKEITVITLNKTLWQALDTIAGPGLLTKEKVERALKIKFHLDESGTVATYPTSQSAAGRPIRLADGVIIEWVNFRTNNKPDDPGFLVLDTGGTCVNRDMVRDHYGELTITGSPRGHSLDESTWFTAFLPSGELSFGFKERNRDCLSGVVVKPKDAGNGKSMD